MPQFKTTYNILTKYDEDELFDENWMDSDKLILPLNTKWDYKKEMHIEDVNIWEVIYQGSNGLGVYAAYDPYAEFYMITTGLSKHSRVFNGFNYSGREIETFYGKNAEYRVILKMKDLNIPISLQPRWVDNEEMYLFS
jgi:hypothetical protein